MDTIDDIPDDHRRLVRTLHVRLDDGVEFTVGAGTTRRRASGNEMVRATINRRGMPLRTSDLYKEDPKITVQITRIGRVDININPNGTYSGPRRICERSLKDAVEAVVRSYAPERVKLPKP